MSTDPCAQLPPVVAEYTPKGDYQVIAGLKTYVISPPHTPTRAIIEVYDVFGLAPQTLQGADRLSAATSSLVVIPDFFEGDYAQPEWFPSDTPEKEAARNKFLKERADLAACVQKLLDVRKAVAEKWPSVDENVGVFGLCFGGKVAVLATGEGNDGPGRKFTVSGTAHPGRLDAKDAEALNVPHICLASPGEPVDVVAQYREILCEDGKVGGYVETYETMFHGWMGARANLKDENNLKEYERGYNAVAAFFNEYM